MGNFLWIGEMVKKFFPDLAEPGGDTPARLRVCQPVFFLQPGGGQPFVKHLNVFFVD